VRTQHFVTQTPKQLEREVTRGLFGLLKKQL
jgi:hypothetical protein